MNEAQFDDVVSGLYRAATGADTWTAALDAVALMFRARLAVFHRVDMADQRLLAQESGGAASIEDGVLQYVRDYHLSDPRRAQMVGGKLVPMGSWYHDHDHFDPQFVAGSHFYQHFLAAYGGRFLSAKVLSPAADQVVLFAFELSPQRGPLDPDERVFAERLGKHVDEALRAYERVRRAQAQMLAGHQLLHTFQQPMWLIDLDRFVHDANAAARDEMQRGRLLVQRASHLAACTGRLDRELGALLHELRSVAHGSSRVLRQQIPGEAQPLWLHLSLLHPQQALGAFGGVPMVLVTQFDPQQVAVFDPYALASLLNLTPAQARVAAGLAEGRKPAEIAAASGTSVTTVNSHLHQVLQRVGANRTEELVRRLHEGHALWAANGKAPRDR